MKVLIACEEKQRVTKAFRAKGHLAYSCDILATEGNPDWHIQGNILSYLRDGWDLMIAFPPCTYLAVSGAVWFDNPKFPDRRDRQKEAIQFFLSLAHAPIDKICLENPVGVISTAWRKPDQIIQPYYFGDEASKSTCLWLKNLPLLRYGVEVQMVLGEITPPQLEIVGPGEFVTHKSGKRTPKWYADALSLPKEERQRIRSRTFLGIAKAMAEQWGN